MCSSDLLRFLYSSLSKSCFTLAFALSGMNTWKNVDLNTITIHVCMFCFDILLLNDEILINKRKPYTLTFRIFPDDSVVKNLPAKAGDSSSLPLSGIFPGGGNDKQLQCSWRIPWTKEPGRLQTIG